MKKLQEKLERERENQEYANKFPKKGFEVKSQEERH